MIERVTDDHTRKVLRATERHAHRLSHAMVRWKLEAFDREHGGVAPKDETPDEPVPRPAGSLSSPSSSMTPHPCLPERCVTAQ